MPLPISPISPASVIAAPSPGAGSILSGEGDDLHKTIMTTQRADLAMELFLQVRNKVVQAYQEVMRMQV